MQTQAKACGYEKQAFKRNFYYTVFFLVPKYNLGTKIKYVGWAPPTIKKAGPARPIAHLLFGLDQSR